MSIILRRNRLLKGSELHSHHQSIKGCFTISLPNLFVYLLSGAWMGPYGFGLHFSDSWGFQADISHWVLEFLLLHCENPCILIQGPWWCMISKHFPLFCCCSSVLPPFPSLFYSLEKGLTVHSTCWHWTHDPLPLFWVLGSRPALSYVCVCVNVVRPGPCTHYTRTLLSYMFSSTFHFLSWFYHLYWNTHM